MVALYVCVLKVLLFVPINEAKKLKTVEWDLGKQKSPRLFSCFGFLWLKGYGGHLMLVFVPDELEGWVIHCLLS